MVSDGSNLIQMNSEFTDQSSTLLDACSSWKAVHLWNWSVVVWGPSFWDIIPMFPIITYINSKLYNWQWHHIATTTMG